MVEIKRACIKLGSTSRKRRKRRFRRRLRRRRQRHRRRRKGQVVNQGGNFGRLQKFFGRQSVRRRAIFGAR